MKRILIFLSIISLAFAAAITAGPAGDMDHKGVCRADVEKFCKDIKPGGGRIMACLKSHEAELSEPCKEHMAMAREKMKEFHAACKADSKKFCSGITPGKGRIAACLKSHEAELSEPCKAFFQKN